MNTEFLASLGPLIGALSPLWFVLIVDIRTRRRSRVAASVGLLIGFAVATLVFGAVWAWWYSWADPALQSRLIAYFGGLLPVVAASAFFWALVRRRHVRRAQWREEHPADDLPPGSCRERAAAREIDSVRAWHESAIRSLQVAIDERGWAGSALIRSLNTERPSCLLLARPTRGVTRFLERQSGPTARVVADWRDGLERAGRELNDAYRSLIEDTERAFFDSVERAPLTAEQRDAVICFDDRVRVIAAAGSGKTSTLVAKAAFAVRKGLVPPDRILVLAFNEAAAKEVDRRLRTAFAGAEMDAAVTAKTFHAFALATVGRARGRKPALARAIDQRREIETLQRIVRELCARDASFRSDWDLFRSIYFDRPDTAEVTADTALTLQTRSGVLVKSAGECLIADWLWYHGVDFEYERPFPVLTADAAHRQYAPDFYYPAADVWHEHLALDRFGAPPAHFDGYLADLEWKRMRHASAGTVLFETTMAGTDDGTALRALREMLIGHAVRLDPDPDRPAAGREAVPEARLLELVEKSLRRARTAPEGFVESIEGTGRTALFLRILAPIKARWEAMLDAEEAIDYEGMIVEATRSLEAGAVEADFDLILVDEFQDMSGDRAALVRALLQRPGSRLFAVGDDWQAINGFAGGDLREMVEFGERWGDGATLRLEQTFRSSQPICEVAGDFVMRTPGQLEKTVRSHAHVVEHPVTVQAVSSGPAQTTAAAVFLQDLQRQITTSRAAGRSVRKRSVLFLGRYNWTERMAPTTAGMPDLTCEFRTIHGAKGLEADHVVLLDVVSGDLGFPSTKSDDPILAALQPTTFGQASDEERRLLYVALTRARRSVRVLTESNRLSPFVTELVADGAVRLIDEEGQVADLCPTCRSAVLRTRTGPYGVFEACARRTCTFTRALNSDRRRRAEKSISVQPVEEARGPEVGTRV